MKTEKQIEAMYDEAAARALEHTHVPGMSYEEGVQAALQWVLQSNEPSPLED